MPSIEYQGLKFSGGKFFIILSLIGAIIGGGWTGYKFYDDYLTMKAQVLEYTAPDLSHYDEQIAVLKAEIDSILDEITLVADVAKELKNDLKGDVRRIETIVEDVETRVKEDSRTNEREIKELVKEIEEDMAELEEKVADTIQKTLANPLAGMK